MNARLHPPPARAASLDLLLMPLPAPSPMAGCARPLGIRLLIERVYAAMPFLTEPEQARANAWLRIAEEDARQYKGKLVWQEDLRA